jgi:hypothetical protein
MELPVTETSATPSLTAPPPTAERLRLLRLYLVVILVTTGGTILTIGIFFYTKKIFGWGARGNLLLCAAQGLIYTLGALIAHPVAARLHRRSLLRKVQVGLAMMSLVPVFWSGPIALTAILLLYVLLSGIQWPVLESLISSGIGAVELSRRITVWNLIWAPTVLVSYAICGPIIAHRPAGIFLFTAVVHLLAAVILMRREADPRSSAPAHLRPEPELIPLRKLAMWLSRLVLPASNAVLYSLLAILPTLPALLRLPLGVRPLVGSAWMLARCLCFAMLGASSWWHTRPRAMLAAGLLVLAGFLGVTLTTSPLANILWQMAFGFGGGVIYTGSLYFGMVLSSGSTEHGGYHEALIGLGTTLGPGIGALAMAIRPNQPNASVFGVVALFSVSMIASTAVSLAARGERTAD